MRRSVFWLAMPIFSTATIASAGSKEPQRGVLRDDGRPEAQLAAAEPAREVERVVAPDRTRTMAAPSDCVLQVVSHADMPATSGCGTVQCIRMRRSQRDLR